MAAQALEEAAVEAGYEVKIETQGADGLRFGAAWSQITTRVGGVSGGLDEQAASSSPNSATISFCMVSSSLTLFLLVFVGVRNAVVERCVPRRRG